MAAGAEANARRQGCRGVIHRAPFADILVRRAMSANCCREPWTPGLSPRPPRAAGEKCGLAPNSLALFRGCDGKRKRTPSYVVARTPSAAYFCLCLCTEHNPFEAGIDDGNA